MSEQTDEECICGAKVDTIDLACWFCHFRIENQHLEWVI